MSSQPDKQLQFSMAPSRFGFSSVTPSANLGDVQTKIEYDLNTGEKAKAHFRNAYIKFAGWTFGHAPSLWNDGDAGADTVDWGGPVGGACYDTPRLPQISYVGNIDKNNSFGFSLEQNSGNAGGAAYSTNDYKIPTIIGMYTYADSWGHVAFRAMGQNYGGYKPATTTTAKDRYNKMFGAFMLSGDFKIAKDDLVWNVYLGKAVGGYGTGMQAAYFDDANKEITGLQNLGWMVGYTHNWTDKVRSNIVLSGVTFKSDDKVTVTDGTSGTGMKSGYYGAVNTFVQMTKTLSFGAEYVYEQAKAFGSNDPWLDIDAKATNKQSASKIHLALKANF
jgi:hypothetical protein